MLARAAKLGTLFILCLSACGPEPDQPTPAAKLTDEEVLVLFSATLEPLLDTLNKGVAAGVTSAAEADAQVKALAEFKTGSFEIREAYSGGEVALNGTSEVLWTRFVVDTGLQGKMDWAALRIRRVEKTYEVAGTGNVQADVKVEKGVASGSGTLDGTLQVGSEAFPFSVRLSLGEAQVAYEGQVKGISTNGLVRVDELAILIGEPPDLYPDFVGSCSVSESIVDACVEYYGPPLDGAMVAYQCENGLEGTYRMEKCPLVEGLHGACTVDDVNGRSIVRFYNFYAPESLPAICQDNGGVWEPYP